MHELALAENVVQLVEAAARREKARRVRTVILEIGALAAVEPDALRFCFGAAARGSLADGAALEIIDIPGAGECPTCRQPVAMQARWDICPSCGAAVEANSGTGMRVLEIDID